MGIGNVTVKPEKESTGRERERLARLSGFWPGCFTSLKLPLYAYQSQNQQRGQRQDPQLSSAEADWAGLGHCEWIISQGCRGRVSFVDFVEFHLYVFQQGKQCFH